jgi:hypothetical protein
MNQRILFTSALLGACIALGGCKFLKKKAPEEAPTVTAAPASAAPVAAAAPTPAATELAPPVAAAYPALDEAGVPAPQDFEDEAFEKVTTANFKAELARLNKEITAPAPKAAP